jgi:hypothetical protein
MLAQIDDAVSDLSNIGSDLSRSFWQRIFDAFTKRGNQAYGQLGSRVVSNFGAGSDFVSLL